MISIPEVVLRMARRRRTSALARILVVLGLLIVMCVSVGELRSAALVRDYFARAHWPALTLTTSASTA